MNEIKNDPDTQDKNYKSFVELIQNADNLLLSSAQIRKTKVIKQQHNENEYMFEVRKALSFTVEDYESNLKDVVGFFSKIDNLFDFTELNDRLQEFFDDEYLIDNNKTLKELMGQLWNNIIHYGMVTGMVDWDEKPFLRITKPKELIAVFEANNVVVQIREETIEPVFDLVNFTESDLKVVHVYSNDGNTIYKKYVLKDSKWVAVEIDELKAINGDSLNSIPYVVGYASESSKLSVLRSKPYYNELVDLCINLINLSSKQTNLISTALIPVAVVHSANIDDDDDGNLINPITEQTLTMAGSYIVLFAGGSKDGVQFSKEDLSYVDSSKLKPAIDAGEVEIARIKTAIQSFTSKTSPENIDVTATLTKVQYSAMLNSRIELANGMRDFLQDIANKFANYLNIDNVGKVRVNLELLNESLDVSLISNESITTIREMGNDGLITDETVLNEIVAKGNTFTTLKNEQDVKEERNKVNFDITNNPKEVEIDDDEIPDTKEKEVPDVEEEK